ncbi:MAG: cytochrome b/b6 domain-containing protein [Desulfopila sp.]|nr:cytochrome b/b6 domain-containing protein [Desulfopila sp.]
MDKVLRHSLAVRMSHWIIAFSGVILLFSGFMQLPMEQRYKIVKIPGLFWAGNFEVTLLIHYLSAAVFTAAVFFHIFYHLRRKEFSLLPKPGDLGGAIQGFLAMFGLGKEPAHGKFQAKQRVIYAVIGSTTLILVITGLIKSYKNLGAIVLDPMFLQLVAFTHTITAMVFMGLFLAHVAALMLKDHRPMIPSMITGKMDKEYARKHHPKWQVD